ncbi:MAG: UDP-N-acetylmuramyl-tripeptide synthetase [Clostridia bacterium]|nr:UDP-N-acetylmuramyl-tripeptide synthetase [Clostridia bacterium]
MLLNYLLEDLESVKTEGNLEINISKIEYDSEKIEKENLFVAINGYKENGNDYIKEAIEKGAVALIVESKYEEEIKEKNKEELEKVSVIYVENARKALAEVSARFYGYPAKQLKLIGITGTKGKTTTAYMIRDIMLKAGKKIGMIGTICITYGEKYIDSERTSPESLELNRIFRDMVDNDIEYVVMEVSSHALELYRVYGMHFIMSVFTNLSHEHLDFHGTMENYLNAKKKLFEMSDFALVNGDDIYTPQLIKGLKCKIAKFRTR